MAYRCGDVVWADLDPSAGHEQNKRRPLVVVSNDEFNSHCNITMAVPITSSNTMYPLHIDVGLVPSDDGGMPMHGYAEVEQLKSLDLKAQNAVRVGRIGSEGMEKIINLVLGCLITPDMTIYSY